MADLLFGSPRDLGTFAGAGAVGDAAALAFLRARKWDSLGTGLGNPQEGHWYVNTTDHADRHYLNGAWEARDPTIIPVNVGLSPYTVLTTDRYLSVTGLTTILLLPTATGRLIRIKNEGVVNVTVTPDGAETIDGVAGAITMLPKESFDFMPNAGNWELG